MNEPTYTPGRVRAAMWVVSEFGFHKAHQGAAGNPRLNLSRHEESLLRVASTTLGKYIEGEIPDADTPHYAAEYPPNGTPQQSPDDEFDDDDDGPLPVVIVNQEPDRE